MFINKKHLKGLNEMLKFNGVYNPLYKAKTIEVTCEVLKPLMLSDWLKSADYETVIVVVDMVAIKKDAAAQREVINLDLEFINNEVEKELQKLGIKYIDFSISRVYPKY